MAAPLTIRFEDGGIHLPALGLWLDAPTRQMGPERVFISHAHTDHVRAHREVILTEATACLVRARSTCKWLEHRLEFHKPAAFTHGGVSFRLTLLPAGHILGSAMAFIETRDQSLLYTGDFKLRPSLTAELCAPGHADILITETTFGRPRYLFPSAEPLRSELVNFCRQALAQEMTPVLLAYSMGKSQELLAGLQAADLPIMLHDEVRKLTKVYAHFGVQFPSYHKWDPATARGKVLLWPPNASRAGLLEQAGPLRTAIVTGWAIEKGCVYRYRTEAAFPLSDHADFNELIELVKKVSPAKVYTVHGFAADFAQSLRDLGCDAQALSESDQLSLGLVFGENNII